jgi:hypothetical protein
MADYGSSSANQNVLQAQPEEKKENPQAYDMTPFVYVSSRPGRHLLGLVGGNEVSLIKGNRVDLESDLYGITRPNTWCPKREHLPPHVKDSNIKRDNFKTNLDINVSPVHLPAYQMWAYPVTLSPLPMTSQVCNQPHKY